MKVVIPVALLAVLGLCPPSPAAERRVIAPPASERQQQRAGEEAGRVTAELEARARREALIRSLTSRPPWPPHLDPDVVSGIQARTIRDAIRR